MLTLRQLEVFQAIAREDSITSAAKSLHLSQPAVSMALSELERGLGGRLFDRLGKSLHLNVRGRRLLPQSMAIIAQIREIEEQLSSDAELLEGELAIGASSTIANYLMPRILGEFNITYPGIRISMVVGNSSDIIQMASNLSIDLGFIAGECRNPVIAVNHWRKDNLVLFCSSGHRLAGKKNVTPRMLADEKWILREHGSGTRATFEHAISGKIEDLRIAMELGQSEAVKHAVEESQCVSCLSHNVVERELEDGRLAKIPVKNMDLTRNLYTISHKEKYLGATVRKFMDSVVK